MSAAGTDLDAGSLRIVGGVRLTRAGRWKKVAGFALGVFASLTLLGPMLSGHVTLIALAAALACARALARLHFGQGYARDPTPTPPQGGARIGTEGSERRARIGTEGFESTRGMVRGAVAIDRGAVAVELRGRSVAFAADEIEDGWFEPGVLATVVLRMKSGDRLAFSTMDETAARAALQAAGVAPSQQVLRVRIASPASQHAGGAALGVLALAAVCAIAIPAALIFAGQWIQALIAGHTGAIAGIALSAPLLFFAGFALFKTVQFLAPPSVVIGVDGVALRGVGLRRFVPYAQVADVTREPPGVWLRLRSREDVLFPTSPETPAAEVVYERIRDAMRAARAGVSPEAKLALLDRNGRSFEAWKAALRDLVQGAGYRTVALDHDELGHVIEDAGATPERRVAAAIALGAAGRPEAEARARIAVQACADERLQLAVDLASRGELDEAALGQAIGGARGTGSGGEA
jgi:hypothetical protein